MNRKLRVLQVGKYFPPARGGIETSLELLCQGLKETVDLQVLVANDSSAEKNEMVNGIPVRRLGCPMNLAGSPICPRLRRALRESRADLIHLHLPHPLALVTWYLAGTQIPLVCTYHSDIVRQRLLEKFIRPLHDRALSRAAAIISTSPNLIDSSPTLQRHRERCTVIPLGVDPEVEDSFTEAEVSALREKFAPPILLSVGRLVYYKGFENLIRAFAQLETPGTLLLIGEGPLRERLQFTIDSLGLGKSVHLLGNVPNTAPYYEACKLFVLPSIARSEAFGMVQLEAMAFGKPVINTWLETGVPFVSLDQKTGLTVAAGDIPGLAQAIGRLLTDDDLRVRYGNAARERVREEFTAEKMVERILALYHRVVADPERALEMEREL